MSQSEEVVLKMTALSPQVTLDGLPTEGKSFMMGNHPKDAAFGSRQMSITSPIYIERASRRTIHTICVEFCR
mgnify:CR=1 FL=1